VGVIRGLAGIKLSGSIKEKGFVKLVIIKNSKKTRSLVMSLKEKYG